MVAKSDMHTWLWKELWDDNKSLLISKNWGDFVVIRNKITRIINDKSWH